MINLQAMRRKNVDGEQIKHWISITNCLMLTVVFVLIASFVDLLYKEMRMISIVSRAFLTSLNISVELFTCRQTIGHLI